MFEQRQDVQNYSTRTVNLFRRREKDKRRDGEELPILFVRNRVMNDGAMAPPTRNDDKKRKRSGGVCGPALVKSVCLSLEVARVRQFSWRDLTASPTNALSNVQYERIIPNGHIKKIRKTTLLYTQQ